MHINDESAYINQGQAIYIPPGSKQHIQNTGDGELKFLAIVHPMWKKEDEVILTSLADETSSTNPSAQSKERRR
jgi:mannose-6-phosphate isomerase-like protein (cupin superfamily)